MLRDVAAWPVLTPLRCNKKVNKFTWSEVNLHFGRTGDLGIAFHPDLQGPRHAMQPESASRTQTSEPEQRFLLIMAFIPREGSEALDKRLVKPAVI